MGRQRIKAGGVLFKPYENHSRIRALIQQRFNVGSRHVFYGFTGRTDDCAYTVCAFFQHTIIYRSARRCTLVGRLF